MNNFKNIYETIGLRYFYVVLFRKNKVSHTAHRPKYIILKCGCFLSLQMEWSLSFIVTSINVGLNGNTEVVTKDATSTVPSIFFFYLHFWVFCAFLHISIVKVLIYGFKSFTGKWNSRNDPGNWMDIWFGTFYWFLIFITAL